METVTACKAANILFSLEFGDGRYEIRMRVTLNTVIAQHGKCETVKEACEHYERFIERLTEDLLDRY